MGWCFLTGAKSGALALFTKRQGNVTSASCLSDVLSCHLFCAFATDVILRHWSTFRGWGHYDLTLISRVVYSGSKTLCPCSVYLANCLGNTLL